MTQTTNYQLNKFDVTDKMNPTTLNGLNDNADKIDTALAGKQNTIDSTHKVSSDNVDDTNKTNKFVTSTDITKLSNLNIAYGTCSTSASTVQKEITITSTGDWTLTAGSIIAVAFTNTNTANSPTLKVGTNEAKGIFYSTAQITTSNLNKARIRQ